MLHGINGIFEAGKFTAIMGASGAGKTTLLNAVAGEAAGGRLSGHILVNGASVDSDLMRKLSVFVFQDDVILATMTVREVVRMSAKLRLPTSVSVPAFWSVCVYACMYVYVSYIFYGTLLKQVRAFQMRNCVYMHTFDTYAYIHTHMHSIYYVHTCMSIHAYSSDTNIHAYLHDCPLASQHAPLNSPP